ncbi:MAG: sigma-70 family RNA polymerase sigma factor [Planctomycetes bacterium]|nr:sigma-70 family RNA polymerase sigma factor [Planctomycetota bacterium]
MENRLEDDTRTLLEDLRRELTLYLRRLLKREDDIEDVIQISFIKLYKSGYNLDSQHQIRKVIFTIAKNTALDRIRWYKNNYKLYEKLQQNSVEINAGDTNLLRQVIEDALLKIPISYRNILRLRLQSGFQFDEIAERLNIPVNTAKVYAARGIKILKSIIDPELFG